MPRMVTEISTGQQFQFSAKDGQRAAAQTRRFKVLLNAAGETFQIQEACAVFVGDPHPLNNELFCTNYDAQYDGESRMVVICTFSYEATAAAVASGGGQDPKSFNPEIRPANWSTSATLYDAPLYSWQRVNFNGTLSAPTAPRNPAGDMYEGLSAQKPIVTISVEQWEKSDPTRHNMLAGVTNKNELKIGSMTCYPRTVMFRGVQTTPALEHWKGFTYRGWKATYEFLYKRNYVGIVDINESFPANIGWDIAVPQSGYNVKAFTPGAAGEDDEVYGQPLRHSFGRVVPPLLLPDNISAGEKVRAMVRVCDYENGGVAQAPSASPVPLNDNGRPRKDTANPAVLVKRYCVTEEYDFTLFKLRLY